MDLEKIIADVCDIAIKAGDRIMEIYDNSADMGVEYKSDDSPLTKADQASNDEICAGLEKLDIIFPIISEENKLMEYEERKDFEYAWMVDPLDGTKEFIKRNGEFTVNIALIHDSYPVAGVVYVPATEELYYAIEGKGSYIRKGETTESLNCNTFKITDPNLRVVCSRSHLNEETQAFMDGLNEPATVSKGSSLKFLVLASGNAELYPRLAPTMEWDTAAAQIILEEAGGSVIHAETEKRLNYNKENLLNPFFIARADLQ